MNITLIKRKGICYIIVSIILGACYKEPDFSLVPHITYKNLIQDQYVDGLGNIIGDTVNITIYFEDGDGDLGLDASDNQGIYADSVLERGIKVLNKFRHNYFVRVLRKEKNTLREVIFPGEDNFNGRFFNLNTLGSPGALSGELSYNISIAYRLGTTFSLGDTLIFEVQIADRSLNLSNEIQAEEIVLGESHR